MFMYHVHRNGDGSWQEQGAVVVAAAGEDHARGIASRSHGDEGMDLWLTPKVTVDYLGIARAGLPAGLICRDYAEV
jgi:hypothetical protein